jgi:hypothetical protein
VRSTPHGQWKMKYGARLNGASSGGASNIQTWKNLWKLQVPGKIRIFGWRSLHGQVPCKSIPANKHILHEGGVRCATMGLKILSI